MTRSVILETPDAKLEILIADRKAIYIFRDQMESDSAFHAVTDALHQHVAEAT